MCPKSPMSLGPWTLCMINWETACCATLKIAGARHINLPVSGLGKEGKISALKRCRKANDNESTNHFIEEAYDKISKSENSRRKSWHV